MQVEVFVVADAATESSGKLNILGSFDTIFSSTLPAVWPFFTIALKLRAYKNDPPKAKIEIILCDPNNKPILHPFASNIEYKYISDSNFTVAHLLLNLQRIVFPSYGEYAVELYYDHNKIMSLPILVKQPPRM